MVKVCQVTSVHPRYDGRIFRKISCSLAANGYDVTLLCIDDLPEETLNGVKFVPINRKFKNRIDRIVNSSKALYKKALEINADIYHIHDPELLKLGVKLKRRGKKVIFDSHEDIPAQIMAKQYIPSALRGIVSKMFDGYEKCILKKYSGVVTATDTIKDKLLGSNSNSVTIKNYPVLDDFLPIKHNIDLRTVCYVGGINFERGVDKLIKLGDNSDYKIQIAGDIPTSFSEVIGAANKNNVTLHGKLDLEEVKKVYASSSIGICALLPTPNHLKALPIKLFEYMAAGLPVVCSDFPEWQQIVDYGKCGICVSPENSQGIDTAIKTILNDKDMQQKMSINGRALAVEKYNWATQEEILLKFYGEL